jgi:hypothetical protein
MVQSSNHGQERLLPTLSGPAAAAAAAARAEAAAKATNGAGEGCDVPSLFLAQWCRSPCDLTGHHTQDQDTAVRTIRKKKIHGMSSCLSTSLTTTTKLPPRILCASFLRGWTQKLVARRSCRQSPSLMRRVPTGTDQAPH